MSQERKVADIGATTLSITYRDDDSITELDTVMLSTYKGFTQTSFRLVMLRFKVIIFVQLGFSSNGVTTEKESSAILIY